MEIVNEHYPDVPLAQNELALKYNNNKYFSKKGKYFKYHQNQISQSVLILLLQFSQPHT